MGGNTTPKSQIWSNFFKFEDFRVFYENGLIFYHKIFIIAQFKMAATPKMATILIKKNRYFATKQLLEWRYTSWYFLTIFPS